eukprot:CAMPEP_0198270278 /NCGR_PEP_ID=MMETSP1447-20131203/44473_1 /TAXON_ID=420782 /ORGANISM="Chaetoceros dichaeta, Strain CCMP1751" /LENGTH=82 /DNA_ID=CAMNT_0043962223 /DNA_START=56 /DNA_END=301 /DNA_ORIENTATION=+
MNTHHQQLPTEPNSYRVGCIGGGQLGRMLALESPRLNIAMSFLDPNGKTSPAAAAAGVTSVCLEGSLNEEGLLRELASGCDV